MSEVNEQIGWTFSIQLRNGDCIYWEPTEESEVMGILTQQIKEKVEALRVATIQIIWPHDAMIVKPEDYIKD